LAQPGDRVVLGPSDDGGYYLIGLKRAHRSLFREITWSTDRVLRETVERALEMGLEVYMLPRWYDVDTAATLSRLCEELFTPGCDHVAPDGRKGFDASHTRRYLSRLMEAGGRERIWPAEGAGAGASR
jgi:hypothetical protein